MKKLFNINMDCTDYLISNNVEAVVDTVLNLSDMAKMASVHSTYERDILNEENVALILSHPHVGELKKFACDKPGITEVNINLLSKNTDRLPEEIIKVAANNLGYVSSHMGVEIPDNLKIYQTGEWTNPRVDITRLNKVAFYQKLNSLPTPTSVPEEVEVGDDDTLNKLAFSEEFENSLRARMGMTHDPEVEKLYQDILENYKKYEPVKIAGLLKVADKIGKMERAIEKGLIKEAEVSTYAVHNPSWFEKNSEKLKEKELPYLTDREREALFGEEGQDVFDSLPAPTKNRLIKEIE